MLRTLNQRLVPFALIAALVVSVIPFAPYRSGQASAASGVCTKDAVIIGVRGSGQDENGPSGYEGFGTQSAIIAKRIASRFDSEGINYALEPVVYPAASVIEYFSEWYQGYFVSRNQGLANLTTTMDAYRNCGDKPPKIVLVGYSQGADVIQSYLYNNSTSEELQRQVVSATLIASPKMVNKPSAPVFGSHNQGAGFLGLGIGNNYDVPNSSSFGLSYICGELDPICSIDYVDFPTWLLFVDYHYYRNNFEEFYSAGTYALNSAVDEILYRDGRGGVGNIGFDCGKYLSGGIMYDSCEDSYGEGSEYSYIPPPPQKQDFISYENESSEFFAGVSKDGSFKFTEPWLKGIQNPGSFGAGDFDGDGCDDIVSWEKNDGKFMVGISDCRDSFTWQPWLSGIQQPGAFAVGDVTCDGRADIVSWEGSDASIRVGRSTGSSFQWGAPWLTNIAQPVFMDTGDVNNDGCEDLVSFEKINDNQVMVGLSVGNDFRWQKWLEGTQIPKAFAVGDFTCDGKDDIVAFEGSDNSFRVGASTGSKFAWSKPWLSGIQIPGAFDAGDVTGDGCDDIVSWEKNNNGQFMVGVTNKVDSFKWDRWLTGRPNPTAFALGNFHWDSNSYDAYIKPGNLLVNRSFENNFTNWGKWGTANRSIRTESSFENRRPRSGQKFAATNSGSDAGSIYQDVSYDVTVGKTYSGKVWLAAKGSRATGRICLRAAGVNPSESSCTDYDVDGSGWANMITRVRTSKSHNRLRFEIYPKTGTTLVDQAWVIPAYDTASDYVYPMQ